MELRPIEEKIIQMRLNGLGNKAIGELTGYCTGAIKKTTNTLLKKGVLERELRGKYKLLIKSYTVSETDEYKRPNRPLPGTRMFIPLEVESHIRLRYKKVPRSVIAKELGLKKLEINLMILQMRLKGSG